MINRYCSNCDIKTRTGGEGRERERVEVGREKGHSWRQELVGDRERLRERRERERERGYTHQHKPGQKRSSQVQCNSLEELTVASQEESMTIATLCALSLMCTYGDWSIFNSIIL